MNSRNYRTIAGILAVIFLTYYGSVTLFYHQHDLNGMMVSHSHPFHSSSHTHSAEAFDTIHHLSQFITVAFVFAAYIPFIHKLAELLFPESVSFVFLPNAGSCQLRAPPVSY
ncbi:MAG: hypothetical protein WCX21_06290 [Bacteroidales bacterium]|jgi:hypothetical protein